MRVWVFLNFFLCSYTELNPSSYIATKTALIILQDIVILRLLNYSWMFFQSV